MVLEDNSSLLKLSAYDFIFVVEFERNIGNYNMRQIVNNPMAVSIKTTCSGSTTQIEHSRNLAVMNNSL